MFPRSGHKRWPIVAALALLALGAAAQEVILHLRNGDRLTGSIASETTNHIVLTNAWTTTGITVPLGTILKREPVVRPLTNAGPVAIAAAPSTTTTNILKKAPMI